MTQSRGMRIAFKMYSFFLSLESIWMNSGEQGFEVQILIAFNALQLKEFTLAHVTYFSTFECIKIKWIKFLHIRYTLYSIRLNGQRYLCEEIPINILFKGQRTLYSFTKYFVHLIYTIDRWTVYWTDIFNKNQWWSTSKQRFSWVWSPISFYIDSIVILDETVNRKSK